MARTRQRKGPDRNMDGTVRCQTALEKGDLPDGKRREFRLLRHIEKCIDLTGCGKLETGQGDMRGEGAFLLGDAAGQDGPLHPGGKVHQTGMGLQACP